MKTLFCRGSDSPFVALTPFERMAAVLLLALIASIVGLGVYLSDQNGQAVMYGSFLVYTAALLLPFIWWKFHPSFLHPIVFYVLWVGIKGLITGQAALPITGLTFHQALRGFSDAQLNDLVTTAFLLDSVALLSLYVGYTLTPHFQFPTFRIPRASGLWWKSLFWICVAAIGLLMLVRHAGGIEGVLMQRGMASTDRISSQIGGHWAWMSGIGVVVPLIWLAFERDATAKPVFWLVVLAAIILKFAATGSRGGTITPLIMLGVIWMLHFRAVPYRVIFVGVVFALVLVGALGELRKATQKANTFDDVAVESTIGEWVGATAAELGSGAGENSGKIAVLGRVPTEVGYLYGVSYASIPFVFVPGALLQNKPDAAGKLVATYIYERPLTGIPPGPVGEAYWNFSYPGVVVIFLLYGMLLRSIGSSYLANSNHPLFMVLYVYVIFNLQPHSPSVYNFFHLVVPAIIVFLSMTFRLPRLTKF